VQVNIKNLIDDAQCYLTVRELRWPDGVECPSCESKQVIKRGFHDTELDRQRYECPDCHTRNWLRVLRRAKAPQIDERVGHQLHPIVPTLMVLEP